MRNLRLIALWSTVLLLASVLPSPADAPVEEFYFEFSATPENILKDAKGALSVMCVDATFIKRFHNRVGSEPSISLYDRADGVLRKRETIALGETKPLSGWLFNGTRARRFPAVERNGNFVKIVWNVEKDCRAWVNIEDLSGLMPAGWGESARVVWFDGSTFGAYDHIDIFRLLGDRRRKLYEDPCLTSRARSIGSVGEIEGDPGNLIAVEQHDGFLRLGFWDPCEGGRRKSQWIRVRDEQGRLTVWPIVGLSC